jgi:acetylornithine deacetylase/succinyl-diaminopimelate desuccinylase-like protein
MPVNPRLAAVFCHIDRQQESFVSRLIDYVRHPSISAHNIGIKEVAQLVVDMLSALGLDVRLAPTNGHPMVLARWHNAPGAPTVLLYGHYDV